jgi:hypothetical protein
MLLHALVGMLVTQLTSGVFGGQVPVINGVPGGAPPDLLKRSTTNRTAYNRTPGKLRITAENSGICETTPGVDQAAGYADLSSTKSLWYVSIMFLMLVLS